MKINKDLTIERPFFLDNKYLGFKKQLSFDDNVNLYSNHSINDDTFKDILILQIEENEKCKCYDVCDFTYALIKIIKQIKANYQKISTVDLIYICNFDPNCQKSLDSLLNFQFIQSENENGVFFYNFLAGTKVFVKIIPLINFK